MRKPSMRLTLGLTAVAAVLGLALWNNREQNPAVPVTSTADWYLPKDGGPTHTWLKSEPYLWLTDHEVLHFKGDGKHGYQAVTFNTQTQTEKPEPNLNVLQKGYIVSASPDGQWVLWNTRKRKDFVLGMAATRRGDGITVLRTFQYDGSEGVWLPDSRHWVGEIGIPTGKDIRSYRGWKTLLATFSVDHPGFQTFSIPASSLSGGIMGVDQQNHMILYKDFLFGPRPQQPLSLVEFSLNSHPAIIRPIRLPQPSVPFQRPRNLILSPQGNRLLWSYYFLTNSNKPSSILDRLSSWLHLPYSRDTVTLELWTSRLNGSPPQRLGV